ncbi:leaf rust 10 disease-resistance locus receptor-like protein kinase-like 2.3 [Quercus suber]|uniref:Leaf rust 10 disease-resistance locus receptor-like protein kinase-like 2.3 n=1 Tax=Quercus suber TaxID=58331 RepID=A0AAW0J1H1_QUESU
MSTSHLENRPKPTSEAADHFEDEWNHDIDKTIPSNRPSMTKVVEMLEASLQSLPIPPNPSLSSPTRSP